jgi:hypothetical protein
MNPDLFKLRIDRRGFNNDTLNLNWFSFNYQFLS